MGLDDDDMSPVEELGRSNHNAAPRASSASASAVLGLLLRAREPIDVQP